jgi:hypothetical protein
MATVQHIHQGQTWWRHDQPQTSWLDAAIPTFDPALIAALAQARSSTVFVLPPPLRVRDVLGLQPQPIFGALEMQADPSLLVPLWHQRQAHWLPAPRRRQPDALPQPAFMPESLMGVHHLTIGLALEDATVEILLGRNLLGASQAWLDAAAHAQTLADTSGAYRPILLVEFVDLGRTFATAAVPFLPNEEYDVARLADGGIGPVAIDLEELFDVPRIGNSHVRLLNAVNLAYTFDHSPLANTRVRFKLGFEGLAALDYRTLFTGVVDRHTVTHAYLDLAVIDSTVQENVILAVPIGPPHFPAAPEASRSLQVPIFVGVHFGAPTIQVASDIAASGTLGQDFTTTDIRLLVRETDAGFPGAGTVTVDSETLDYTLTGLVSVNGQTYTYLSGLTRSAPALHVAGATVTLQNPTLAYLTGWGVQRLNVVRYDGAELALSEFSVSTQEINGQHVVLILPEFVVDPEKAITVDINAAAPIIPLNHSPTETPEPLDPVAPANLLTNPGFETGDATGFTVSGGSVTVGTGVSGGGNLVTNGGFESGTTGWTTSGATLAAGTTSPTPYEGTQRGALTGGQDVLGDAYRDVTVTPNVLHEFSFAYQNAVQASPLTNGSFEGNLIANVIPDWTITENTQAIITPGDFRYVPTVHATGLPPGFHYLYSVAAFAAGTMPFASGHPWYSDFQVQFYQDAPTVIGQTYRFLFAYMTVDDLSNAFAGAHRTTDVGYKLGTPADDDLYVPLTQVGQSVQMVDGLYNNGLSKAPLTSLAALTFVATTTTTRVSFVLKGDSPAAFGATNGLNPLLVVLDDVRLDPTGGTDQSTAAFRLGTPASPGLYQDVTLPVTTAWTGKAGRFVPTSGTVRVTLRSQYRLHVLASFFDAVRVEEVTSQVATPIEGMYRAALTGGLNSYGNLVQEVETTPGTQYAYRVAYQTERQGSLVTNGDFSNGLTGWTTQNNVGAQVGTTGIPPVLLVIASQAHTSVEIYQDVPTLVGQMYVLTFAYLTAMDTVRLNYLTGERHTDVGYKVGTAADDDLYIPLTFVGQAYQYQNGQPPAPKPAFPFTQSPQVAFTATTTSTRLTFRFLSDRNMVGQVPQGQNPFPPLSIQFHGVMLVTGAVVDESQASLQLGPPATPGLYRDLALAPSPGTWTYAIGTFTASDETARLTMRAQYTVTGSPKAVYLDDFSLLAQPQAGMGIAGAPVVLSNDAGENPIDVLLFLLQTFTPTVGVNQQAFEEARALLTEWKFTGILTAPGDFNTLLQRLAQQCKSLLLKDEQGDYTITVLDSQRETVFDFTPENILRNAVVRSSSAVDSLYSSINVYYNTQRGGSTNPADYAGVAYATPTGTSAPDGEALIALCAAARERLDRDHRYDFFADFVHDLHTANLLLAWLVGRFTVEQTIVQFTSWIDAAAVRPGQVVRVEHRTLPQGGAAILGEVIGWHYQAPSWNHELVVRSLGLSPDVGDISPDAPVANPDVATTSLNMAVTLDVPFNDMPALGATLDRTSVDLDPATPGQQVVRVVDGRGVFVVNFEGLVTFTPETNIAGQTQITYTIRDNWRNVSNEATITINVSEPGLLIADDATVAIQLSLAGGGEDPPPDEWESVGSWTANGDATLYRFHMAAPFESKLYFAAGGYDINETQDMQGTLVAPNDGTRYVLLPGQTGWTAIDAVALAVYNARLYVALEESLTGAGVDDETTTVYSTDDTLGTYTSHWNYAAGVHVRSMAVFDGRLYVSSSVDLQSWNGTSTTTEQSSAFGAMVVYSSALYAAAGSALWRATASGAWTQIHTFIGTCTALGTFGANLVAGVVNGSALEVWSYNDTTWTSLGTVASGTNYTLRTIAEFNSLLYVGIGAPSGPAQAWRWNGTNWSLSEDFTALTTSLLSEVEALAVFDNHLYAGVSSPAQSGYLFVTPV